MISEDQNSSMTPGGPAPPHEDGAPGRIDNVGTYRGFAYALLFELPIVLLALILWLVWRSLH